MVIAYMSKALGKHELSYCVTRKELLAVVTALRNFHPYLYGQEILLRTHNAAVSWMRNLETLTDKCFNLKLRFIINNHRFVVFNP